MNPAAMTPADTMIAGTLILCACYGLWLIAIGLADALARASSAHIARAPEELEMLDEWWIDPDPDVDPQQARVEWELFKARIFVAALVALLGAAGAAVALWSMRGAA